MQLSMPKQSEKCQVRDYEITDIAVLADIEFDHETKRYVGIPAGTKEDWIKKQMLDSMRGWAVVALPEKELAGRVCLSPEKYVVMLEIIIAKRFWGKRLGREAASLMIPAAFNEWKELAAIRAEVHPKNEASLALLNSFGFRYKSDAGKKPMLLYELGRENGGSASPRRAQ